MKALLRRDVLLFFIISLLFFISIHAFDPFLAPYIMSLNVEARVMGIIIGATGLASMLLRFPTGILSDRFRRRKRIIQIGLLFTLIAWPVVYLWPTPETLFIAKLADGVTSATWVVYNVMFVAYFPPLEAAAAIAMLSVTSPVGTFYRDFGGGIYCPSFRCRIELFGGVRCRAAGFFADILYP